jgi:hypothetical protein
MLRALVPTPEICVREKLLSGGHVLNRVGLIVVALTFVVGGFGASPSLADGPQDQADPRMFAQTGFRIDRDSFWQYFQHRGGVTTFGYPVSRDFQFLGCTSQFFQRLVIQQCDGQGPGTLNLLDDGLLPYTKINGSTFPAPDDAIKAKTPKVGDANYSGVILGLVGT